MPKPNLYKAKGDCDKARLAKSILDAAQRAEDLGFGERSPSPPSPNSGGAGRRSRPGRLSELKLCSW